MSSAIPHQHPGTHVQYSDLNTRQMEIYNFQKVSSLLADYGYACIKLSDDWKGADFLADHFSADYTLRVQLKGCLTIDKKYLGKGIHMTFPVHGTWYLIDHDELVEIFRANTNALNTKSWQGNGLYFVYKPSVKMLGLIKGYALRVPPVLPPAKKGSSTKAGAVKHPCFVRIGRDVVGPMSQTQAAVTGVVAAADMELVAMEALQKIVGTAALRSVDGVVSGDDLWDALVLEHGLDEGKVKQWAVDQPIFRDEQTWVVQKNVWSQARLAKLAKISEVTDGAVELILDNQSDVDDSQ